MPMKTLSREFHRKIFQMFNHSFDLNIDKFSDLIGKTVSMFAKEAFTDNGDSERYLYLYSKGACFSSTIKSVCLDFGGNFDFEDLVADEDFHVDLLLYIEPVQIFIDFFAVCLMLRISNNEGELEASAGYWNEAEAYEECYVEIG